MDYVGLTLSLTCLGFMIFLIFIYFSKKSIRNLDNLLYRYICLSNLILIICELLFALACYFTPNNLLLIEIFKRTSFYIELLFFVAFAYYVIVIAIENNKKMMDHFREHSKLIFFIILTFVFIIGVLQYTLPLEVFYRSDGYVHYLDGPASYYLTLPVIGILLAIVIPAVIINRKTFDKKRMLPLLIVSILEIITFIVNLYDLSITLASFSLTITCYLMYFTIENPDIKEMAELEYLKNQAEKASNAKSDFLSSMSHEIRTPLNAILGLSQMIEQTNDIDSVHRDIKDIIASSENLLEIVNGILDISNLETGKIELQESIYSPRNVFNEIVKLMNIRLGNKDVELKTYYDEELPAELYGDRDKVKQIITNLLSNAVKYTNKGSIEFKVECENSNDYCNMVITVKDTGIGMKKEMLPVIFNKFTRDENFKDSNISGTGLGLAITKNLIELFGGKIQVKSKEGEGSTFIIRIKQKLVDTDSSLSHLDRRRTSNRLIDTITRDAYMEDNDVTKELFKNKISLNDEFTKDNIEEVEEEKPKKVLLVVDDNKINLKVASRMLEDLEFEVDMAHSGYECLDKVKDSKNKYDLIFMDIMMPEMNGVETMKKLREMDEFNIPIIALTADAMDGSREKYLAYGFDEYVSKPIIKQLLQEALGKYVDCDDINVIKKDK